MLQILCVRKPTWFFYVNIDQGINKGKSKAAQIEKGKITSMLIFLYIKYSKFRRASLEYFVEHKPFISEEFANIYLCYKYMK